MVISIEGRDRCALGREAYEAYEAYEVYAADSA
jgi:hypothetical protein